MILLRRDLGRTALFSGPVPRLAKWGNLCQFVASNPLAMKTTMPIAFFARRLGLAAVLVLLANLLSATEPTGKVRLDASAPLHVYVDVPGAIRPGALSPWSEEDFSRVLGGYVRTEFKKGGYTGEVVVHERWAELPKEGQRLEVNVIRWSANRTSGLECTLTAELTAADGRSESSGIVSETQLMWTRTNYGVADALENVARQSMRKLHRNLTEPVAAK